jgi:hypothetical protein
MTYESIVRLKILSHAYTPDCITAMLGVKCDKEWRAGDTRKHTTIVESANGWVLHSSLPRTADMDAHIDLLLQVLEPVKESIRRLSATETVELSIVIYSPSPPALRFDASIVARIAELGAGLDVDLYIT